jgi:thiol-disulfide isomerase/thioredoxin
MASAIRFLLVWGLPLAAGVLVLSLYLDHRISRGHRWGWPPSWSARVGKVFLNLVNVAAVYWLVTILFIGSGRNLASGARRFQSLMGEPTPDLVFHRVDSDKDLKLKQFRGRVVLLNLWATWCAPCVKELPELDRLQQIYGDRGLTVITLSQQEREELLGFAARHPSSAINGYAKDMGWLEVGDARPVSLVLDRKGVLREFVVTSKDFAGFESMIQPYL